MEGMTGKEAVRNMEYLVCLLHKEWERSGRPEAEVSIGIVDRNAVGAKLAEEIRKRQERPGMEEMDFQGCMELSKENFVLLRLARKVKEAGDAAGRRGNAGSFLVELDGEEYGLFRAFFQVREA